MVLSMVKLWLQCLKGPFMTCSLHLYPFDLISCPTHSTPAHGLLVVPWTWQKRLFSTVKLLQDIEYRSLCYTVGPCHLFYVCVYVCIVCNSFATPGTILCQTPLSIGFPRQEYWSGLPFPTPEDVADLGYQSYVSCIGWKILYHVPPGKLHYMYFHIFMCNGLYQLTPYSFLPPLSPLVIQIICFYFICESISTLGIYVYFFRFYL